MPKKVGKYPIPFKRTTGEMLNYPDRGDIEWRDNHVFYGPLIFSHFERGRSAAHAIFKDNEERRYTVFLTDFEEMIPLMQGGVINEPLTFIKRGQNYGACLSPERN